MGRVPRAWVHLVGISTVSNYENVMTNFGCLPDAWDGAINSQRAYGGLDNAAVGPLPITYTADGLRESGP